MQRTYVHPPDLKHYPKWMREYLIPENFPTRANLREYEKALLHVHEFGRVDPICAVLFENTVGEIRLRHHVTELCIKHEDAIDILEKRVDELEKLVKSTRRNLAEMEMRKVRGNNR